MNLSQSHDCISGDITTAPTPSKTTMTAKLFRHTFLRDSLPNKNLQYLSVSLNSDWRLASTPSLNACSFCRSLTKNKDSDQMTRFRNYEVGWGFCQVGQVPLQAAISSTVPKYRYMWSNSDMNATVPRLGTATTCTRIMTELGTKSIYRYVYQKKFYLVPETLESFSDNNKRRLICRQDFPLICELPQSSYTCF